MFRKLEINIPFAEVLAQMPHYAKCMKYIIRKKRKLDEKRVVSLSTNCSVIIQKKLPQKMQDSESFTIPYIIGNHEFRKALCDYGVNLLPLSVVKRLSLGELTPTTLFLQMADRSMTQTEGILEDVLVKVGKFIFPVDFVVIDMEEDKKVSLLLGMPFLATGAALIDVKKRDLTLRVSAEEVYFNLNQILKQPDFEKAQCIRIDSVIHDRQEMKHKFVNHDPLEECMINSLNNENLDGEMLNENAKLTEIVFSLSERSNAESTTSTEVKVRDVEKSSEGLILKELPKHQKYAFLGDERFKPVIIAANITKKKSIKC